MPLPACLRALPAVAALVLLPGPAALAAGFSAISQQRAVAMSGELAILDLDTGTPYTASLSPSQATAAGDFSPFDAAVGLGTLVLDTPVGSASGAGRATQHSSFGDRAIVFDGAADVFMSGSASGNADVGGSGSASSRLQFRFSLDGVQPVRLTMSSELGPVQSGYDFVLRHDGGPVVWNQTVIYDDEGNAQRSFSRLLDLTAGVYELQVQLGASSSFYGDQGSAGRALASFTLAAVPEPGAAALLAAGLLGLFARRRRR